MSIITARTYPLNEEGEFQSKVAENVYKEVKGLGIDREQARKVIQAFIYHDGISQKEYEEYSGICGSCKQALK